MKEISNSETLHGNNIYDYWFSENTESIIIVTSRESKPPPDAYTYSKEYAYIDQVGNKDLLLKASILLARYYPLANIEIYFSEDLLKIRYYKQNNLVILGGPSSKNKICQEFMRIEKISSIIKYPPANNMKSVICEGCENLEKVCPRESICVNKKIISDVKGIAIVSLDEAKKASIPESRIESIDDDTVKIKDCVDVDYGFFAAFNNPFDPNKANRVVMISGIHTFGGVGALQAFENQTKQSRENYDAVRSSLASFDNCNDFMCFMKVIIDRDQGNPICCPEINKKEVYSLNRIKSYIPINETQTKIFGKVNLKVINEDLLELRKKLIGIINNNEAYKKRVKAEPLLNEIEQLLCKLDEVDNITNAVECDLICKDIKSKFSKL